MQQSVKRIYLALGAVCILTGAALLGIAGYGVIKDDSAQRWIYVRPVWPSPSPGALGSVADPDGEGGTFTAEPFRLVIEKLGVDAPVAPFGLDEQAIPVVPFEPQLVAWYNFSAYPGYGDNAVFAGHKTWRGEAVFYKLEELANGDQIILRGDDGSELLYRVSQMATVDSNDQSATHWMQSTGTNSITLITCGGERFYTDTPAGADYTHRVVVRADLVDNAVSSGQTGG